MKMTNVKFRIGDIRIKGPVTPEQLHDIALKHGIRSYWRLTDNNEQITNEMLKTYDGNVTIEPITYTIFEK